MEMSGCVEVQVHSPRMLCPCGKTVRAMTEEERADYDNALRTLAETTGSAILSAKEEAIFEDEPTDANPEVRVGLSAAR